MEALAAGADRVAAGRAANALVVVSDALRPGLGTNFEARCGAGAAAVVLGTIGAAVEVQFSYSRPLVDRYRGDGELDNRDLYDARLFREEMFLPSVEAVVQELVGDADGHVDAWSLPDPDGRLGAVIAKKAGAATPASAAVYAAVGDSGAAAALLGAIGAMDTPGTVAIVGTGGGRTTGARIDVETPVRGAREVAAALAGGRPASYADMLRSRGQLVPGGETIPMGVPPESALFARGADEMLGLLGGRCVDCGTISTPPSIHPTCINCGGPKLEPVQLARSGTVQTYVINHTMPAPFVAPLPIAVLDMDDGARLMLQVVGDGSDVSIGRVVRLVLRKYAHERGVPVYGYKAQPLRAEEKVS
jgi:hydroxymethylglutaryl-CoA synthase